MRRDHIVVTTLLFILSLGGCTQQSPVPEPDPSVPTNPEVPTDPDVPTRSLQDFIDTRPNASLNDRAIIASSVYDDLSVDRYPLMIMTVREKGALEAYIAEQGLSEEAFLAHPKLPEFIKSHLIYDEVDVLELRTTPGARATFESAAGTEVVIENVPAPRMGLVNGVSIDLLCAEGRDPTYSTDETGLLCYVAEPIVQDFDWSQ